MYSFAHKIQIRSKNQMETNSHMNEDKDDHDKIERKQLHTFPTKAHLQ